MRFSEERMLEMTVYEKLKKKGKELALLGLEQGTEDLTYFCTPKGARIIGWRGVDGIHFCFIRGFGQMIFAVSPQNLPGDYVHPIAKNFDDLLGLLLTCGTIDAIEQLHLWDKTQFDAYLRANAPTKEQMHVLDFLRNELGTRPIDRPYEYVKNLQDSFDYDSIKYPAEYYDPDMNPDAPKVESEWKVTFEGGFRSATGRAGKEVRTECSFSWQDRCWYVPAIYLCGKGLVLDLCMCAASWEPPQEDSLDIDFLPSIILNGKKLDMTDGYGLRWVPKHLNRENGAYDPDAERILEHYGLSLEKDWGIYRFIFPWEEKRRPKIRSLRLCLSAQKQKISCAKLHRVKTGDKVAFLHPITKRKHVFTVHRYEEQKTDPNIFSDKSMRYPVYYTVMEYTLEPDLTRDVFMVEDCSEGDRPEPKDAGISEFAPQALGVAGVLLCEDGIKRTQENSAKTVAGSSSTLHTAASSLYFMPPEMIEWRLAVWEKTTSDIEVSLLEEEKTVSTSQA